MRPKNYKLKRLVALLGVFSLVTLGLPSLAVAAEKFTGIEEIVVTATKIETSIQDTPIAVSAFSQDQLDSKLINDTMNLQFNVPNMLMTKTNFTSQDIRIRGVGSGAVGSAGDSGVGITVNGQYQASSRIFETQFLDVERVEVLRGPQGTLYGRNTTGGVVNLITAKADPSEFMGVVDAKLGNYADRQVSGWVNMPVSDSFAVRVAGLMKKRDGFVVNEFTGNDIDDRDMWSGRLSLTWEASDNFKANFMTSYFEEDDTRARSQKQACNKDPAGVLGCLPGSLTYGTANTAGSIGGALVGTVSSISQGAYGVLGAVLNDPALLAIAATAAFPVDDYPIDNNPDDPRRVNMDFEPEYYAEETMHQLEMTWDLGDYTIVSSSGITKAEVSSLEDYEKAVPTADWTPSLQALAGLAAIPALPAALAPTLVGLGAGALVPFITDMATGVPGVGLWAGNPALASLAEGVPVLLPGGRGTVFTNSAFGVDESSTDNKQWTQELRIQSNYDGNLNFLVGGFYLDYESETHYVVRNAALVLPGLLLPINPAVFPAPAGDPNDPQSESDPYMLGYDNDTREYNLTAKAVYGEFYWDVSDQLRMTFGARYSDETKDSRQRVLYVTFQDLPSVQPNNAYYEPTYDQAETSWKINATYNINDETMIYATVSNSFKSGGFNPISDTSPLADPARGGNPANLTFAPEAIDAYEFGFKSTVLDGRLQLNGAMFYYDYSNLQQSKIVSVTSLNQNSDAEILGAELEAIWAPIDNLRLSMNVSWLDTEIGEFNTVDTANPNASTNPANATDGVVSINGVNFLTTYPADGNCEQPAGNPCAGIPQSLKGNQIAGSPELSYNIGASYTFQMGGRMDLVVASNYYWQDEYYVSNFNTAQNLVGEWEVWNASARLTGGDSGWYVEGWIKNILNEDYVTGQYLTSSVSSLFTNQFILDPQTFGVSVGTNF
jgi:outer membrane receptor protein involved in Fe transport